MLKSDSGGSRVKVLGESGGLVPGNQQCLHFPSPYLANFTTISNDGTTTVKCSGSQSHITSTILVTVSYDKINYLGKHFSKSLAVKTSRIQVNASKQYAQVQYNDLNIQQINDKEWILATMSSHKIIGQ